MNVAARVNTCVVIAFVTRGFLAPRANVRVALQENQILWPKVVNRHTKGIRPLCRIVAAEEVAYVMQRVIVVLLLVKKALIIHKLNDK